MRGLSIRGAGIFWGVFVLLGLGGACWAEFRQSTAPWQQAGSELEVVLGLEREVFYFSDGVGRFVVALQSGKGAKPEEFEAAWSVRRSGGGEVAKGSGSLGTGMMVVDFDLAGMKAGDYEVAVSVQRGGKEVAVEKRGFAVGAAAGPVAAKQGRVPLLFPSGIPATGDGSPVNFGVPFPRGVLTDLSRLRVVDAKGREVPAQFQVRSGWSSDPRAGVRWLGVDLQAPQSPAWWPDRKETPFFLEYGKKRAKAAPKSPLHVETVPEGVRVNTGSLAFLVRAKGFNLLDEVMLNGTPVLQQNGGGGAYVVDQEGTIYRTANDLQPGVTIEESGPLRAVIRVEGWYVKDGATTGKVSYKLPTDRLCKFVTRIEAYAGLPWVRVLHTWVNTSDSYSVFFKDVGFSLVRPENETASFGVVEGAPIDASVGKEGVYLLQHLADKFEVRSEGGAVLAQGARSDGTMAVTAANGQLLSLANRETWQRFPKELEALPGELRLHLWPAHGKEHPEINPFAKDRYHQLWFAHQGQFLDLRFPWETLFAVMRFSDNPSTGIYKPGGTAMGGVQSSAMGIALTTDFMLHFSEKSRLASVRQDMAAFASHAGALADPQWVADSGVFGPTHPYDPKHFEKFERAAENAIKGIWNLQSITGEYGMFLYRGWHHNKYLGEGHWVPYRLYSAGHHYDPYLPWQYFARSGDPQYLEMGLASMRHLTDLGITHYSDPDYEYREFYSEQKKLVGATGHTNGFVLWGGDHAILAHLTSYGAVLLGHYLTGDLRFREVIEEWKTTLLEDRLNPEWNKAARMNWGKNVGEINRDNNQALGEMLDLYQLTYDPRLLGMMQLCVGSMEQNSYQWSRELVNVLDFRRSPKLKQQLVEQAKESQLKPRDLTHFAGRLALAAWVAPGHGFERDALWRSGFRDLINSPNDRWDPNHPTVTGFSIPDTFLDLPVIMAAAAPLMQSGNQENLTPQQYLPLSSELGGKVPAKVVVKEDEDREFTLNFEGEIASTDGRVRVVAPDGREVVNAPLPPGKRTSIKVPKDGQTGEYIVWVLLQTNLDTVRLPLSDLPHEVYVTSYWIQPTPQCFFLGAPNAPDGKLILGTGKNGFLIASRGDFETLAQWKPGEMTTAGFEVKLPKDGAWFITTQGRYFSSPKEMPVILSLSPQKAFVPSR